MPFGNNFFVYAFRFLKQAPNGLRYPLVGGTRERHFVETNLKPRKLPENAPSPTSRVHAVLGNLDERKTPNLKRNTTIDLTKLFPEALSTKNHTYSKADQPYWTH